MPIASGATGEALIFEIDKTLMGSEDPLAVADADGTGTGLVFECDEFNNSYSWDTPVCQ
jgi:hypothetical protein